MRKMQKRNHLMKNLKIAIILNLFILVVEIIGGVISNSLALLSDAAHVFMHLVSFTLTFFALKIALKPPTISKTFGYHRAEILAALINGVTLTVISFFIFYEAYSRIISPPHVKSTEMLIFASVGLIVNLWVVLKFKGYADLNIRSAFLHALGDTLSSVVVIFGAGWIIFTGQYVVDPILSILIGIIILFGSFRLVRDSTHILLEGVPKGIDVDEVITTLKTIKRVKGVHDLHIWSICSNIHTMSAHILTDDIRVSQTERITKEINNTLKKFNITHSTLQFECKKCGKKKLHHIKH